MVIDTNFLSLGCQTVNLVLGDNRGLLYSLGMVRQCVRCGLSKHRLIPLAFLIVSMCSQNIHFHKGTHDIQGQHHNRVMGRHIFHALHTKHPLEL